MRQALLFGAVVTALGGGKEPEIVTQELTGSLGTFLHELDSDGYNLAVAGFFVNEKAQTQEALATFKKLAADKAESWLGDKAGRIDKVIFGWSTDAKMAQLNSCVNLGGGAQGWDDPPNYDVCVLTWQMHGKGPAQRNRMSDSKSMQGAEASAQMLKWITDEAKAEIEDAERLEL